jgi:hypothetical protein
MATEATADLGCDAAFAWKLLADVRLVPEWIAGVAEATVIDATHVRYVGMPSTGSLEYTVRYRFDEEKRRLDWESADGEERKISGWAWIEPIGEGTCRFHYALETWTARTLPQWARDTLADDTPARAAAAFQRFVERRLR